MNQLLIFVKLYVGITIIFVVIKALDNQKKNIRERFTKTEKWVLFFSIIFIVGFIFCRMYFNVEDTNFHYKYFDEASHIILAFYSTIFYLNHFGVLNNWLSFREGIKN